MNSSARHAVRVGIAALVALGTTSAALARPDTRTMTCVQAQDLIVRSGAIVLTTGRHTYDRYVAGWGFCDHPNVPTATYIQTRDTRHCPVYNCQRSTRLFND